MAYFNLADYQPVEERIRLFWAKYPNGRLLTEIVFDDGNRVVMRCSVYTDREDDRPTTVDYAEETKSAKGVNQDSRVENCATSCTGRAISLLGGEFSPKGKRPSREEMEKVQRNSQQRAPERPQAAPVRAEQGKPDRPANGFLTRLNAIEPPEQRLIAKQMFADAFGHPDAVSEEDRAEADALISMYEAEEEVF